MKELKKLFIYNTEQLSRKTDELFNKNLENENLNKKIDAKVLTLEYFENDITSKNEIINSIEIKNNRLTEDIYVLSQHLDKSKEI